MEEIDIEWCKQHGMVFVHVNVARDTSYYLEKDGHVFLVYTKSTTGEQKLYCRNLLNNKEIEFTVNSMNKNLTKRNILTTDDLHKLCDLIELDYPFNESEQFKIS